MSIWNKVLIGLIAVTALAFGYMSMRTLKTHQYWRELCRDLEKKTASVAEENELLSNGSPEDAAEPVMGIKQYRQEIADLVQLRGRVWTKCEPKNANAETGQVTVATDLPKPNLIREASILYVFEENETAKGSRYIGQFTVTAVADTSAALTPVQPMNERELTRLKKSTAPWVMYEKMPSDNHWTFAHLNEAEKKERLPADTLAEFLHDGENATWEKIDEEWKVPGELVDELGKPLRDKDGNKIADAKGKYQRPLRDYELLFTNRNLERKLMSYVFAAIQEDLAKVETAAAETKEQIASRKSQIAGMKADYAKVAQERKALGNHVAALKKKVDELNAEVRDIARSNLRDAAQIAKVQLEAARQIDSRAPTMANTADSGK